VGGSNAKPDEPCLERSRSSADRRDGLSVRPVWDRQRCDGLGEPFGDRDHSNQIAQDTCELFNNETPGGGNADLAIPVAQDTCEHCNNETPGGEMQILRFRLRAILALIIHADRSLA